MTDRKIFIIDTSVLLYDKTSIHSFPENDVLIPLVVLDELDRFKDKKGLVGENARYINRYLDDLRTQGSLHQGIELENGQTIKVALTGFNKVPIGLDPEYADNKMISLALGIQENVDNKVILITKDINFRVKCDSLGICSEDYYKDKVTIEDGKTFKGYVEIEAYDPYIIDELYSYIKNKSQENDALETFLELFEEQHGRKPYENEYFCVKYDHKLKRFKKG